MYLGAARRVGGKRAIPAVRKALNNNNSNSSNNNNNKREGQCDSSGEAQTRGPALRFDAPEFRPMGRGAISSFTSAVVSPFVPVTASNCNSNSAGSGGVMVGPPLLVPMYTMYAYHPSLGQQQHMQFQYASYSTAAVAAPMYPMVQNPARIMTIAPDGTPVPVPQLFDKLEYKMRGNRMVKVEELMEMLQSCSTEEDLRYLMKLARRVKAKGQTLPARFLTKLIHQSCNLECPELGLEATREEIGELSIRGLDFLLFRYAAVERDPTVSMQLWRMFEERNLIPSSQSVDVMVRHFVYRRKYIRAFNIVMEALDYADGGVDTFLADHPGMQLPLAHKTLVLTVSALQKADHPTHLTQLFQKLEEVHWATTKNKCSVLEQFRAWALSRNGDWKSGLEVLAAVLEREKSTLQVNVARDLLFHCPEECSSTLRHLITTKGGDVDLLLREAQEEHEESSSGPDSSTDSEESITSSSDEEEVVEETVEGSDKQQQT